MQLYFVAYSPIFPRVTELPLMVYRDARDSAISKISSLAHIRIHKIRSRSGVLVCEELTSGTSYQERLLMSQILEEQRGGRDTRWREGTRVCGVPGSQDCFLY